MLSSEYTDQTNMPDATTTPVGGMAPTSTGGTVVNEINPQYQNPDGTPKTAGSPSLITTSSASQINHANNVTGLNSALSAITPATPRYDNNGNVYNAPDGKGGFYSGPVAGMPKVDGVTPPADTIVKPDTSTVAKDAAVAGVSKAFGADSGTQPAGTDPVTGEADPTAGLPTGIASMYKNMISSQQQAATNASATLEAARGMMNNDPAAQAAASYIQQQYGVLISAMQEKNKQVLGGYTRNAARDGGLQYANDMTETFMSNEMDRASARIADLTSKMTASVMKSNAAYAAKDIKAFDTAQKAVDSIRKEQSTTMSHLLTATNNQVKAVQAQTKIDAASQKATLTADINTSKASAPGIVNALKGAGITDLNDPQVGPYVEAYATVHGISDPGTLMGELSTAWQTAQKTSYTVNKPYPTKSGGTTPAFSVSKGIAAVTPQFEAEVKASGSTDGYIDPAKWIAARTNWMSLGGTAASFNSNFKGYLNPASYPLAGFKVPAASTVL